MFLVRNDKYEGKPIYWIEEEIELEWNKTSSRSHAESGEYQVSGNIADAMADSMEALRPDVKSIAGGKLDGAGILKSQNLTTKNHKSSDNSLIAQSNRLKVGKMIKTLLKNHLVKKFHPFLIHL